MVILEIKCSRIDIASQLTPPRRVIGTYFSNLQIALLLDDRCLSITAHQRLVETGSSWHARAFCPGGRANRPSQGRIQDIGGDADFDYTRLADSINISAIDAEAVP